MAVKAAQKRIASEIAASPSRRAAGTSGWIMSPLKDSLLFIGAPLVCIVTLLPLRAVWKSEDISLFLLAFFTFGHHLPGFLRAYGDRELFARYRLRFLLAPPLVFVAIWWFASRDLHGVLLLVFAWDIWHVLMQHYGFMRIYDAKQGAVSPVTARLDWALALAWYLTLILLSPHYSHSLLFRAYSSGLPLLPPAAFTALQIGMSVVSATLTLIYLGHNLHPWKQGCRASWRKLTMMGVFLAATYYLYVGLSDFTTGFAVWSAFHCIQYYGIVWSFNRNRVARSQAVTGFVRFLFQPRLALVALYVGLILLYGGINYAVHFVGDESWRGLLLTFVATSGTLHYYYDGFIWRIREPETGKYFGLATAAGSQDQMAHPRTGDRQVLRTRDGGRIAGSESDSRFVVQDIATHAAETTHEPDARSLFRRRAAGAGRARKLAATPGTFHAACARPDDDTGGRGSFPSG
ncbi:MAG: hypothetical protein ACREEM_01605 [Blastocatellia bacterium]